MIYQFILLFSFIIRLPLLNQSLWLDESIQALALMGKMGPILDYAKADFQPPLYHFLLYIWTRIAGFSEISLRTPSLIAGVLTVYFVMQIARKLKGRKLAISSGIIAATNPLLIYYSQEGRTYMLTTMLVTASFSYFLKLEKSKRARYLYLLFTIAALYSSYLAWIAVFIQLLILFFKHKKRILLPVISFLSLIPWLPHLYQQLSIGLSTASNFSEWGRVVGGFELMRIPRTWIKFAIGRVSFENRYLYLAVVALLFLYHLSLLAKTKLFKNKTLLHWLVTVPLLALIVSIFIPVYQYFRVLFILPAYILILSSGVINSTSPRSNIKKIAVLQLVFLVYFWISPKFHRENWRGLVDYVHSSSPESAAVALPSISQSAPLKYYDVKYEIIQPNKLVDYRYKKVFYINYVEDLFDREKRGRENLELAGYNIEEEKTFNSLHVITYTK